MEECTHARVEAAWERLLGLPEEQLFAACTVTRHGRLGDYPGVFVVGRNDAVHVTAPDFLLDQVTAAVAARCVDELLSGEWWERMLGCTYEVRGPAIHHYLDHPVHADAVASASAPAATLRMAAPDDLAALRAAVGEVEWEEAGFEDEPAVVFAVEVAGEVVAASNLSSFDDMTADLGVLTHPAHRGRGLGARAAAAAADLSVEQNRLARWVARVDNAPSMALARRLGFEPWCRQLAVRPRV